jgi:glutathione synthase/RimK-type ligase-like ATP-grasp enzyme
MSVLLATCAALPGLYGDDRYLLDALTRRGFTAEPAVWEDPHRDWGAASLCLIRSAWDYSYRRRQFLAWAEYVAASSRLWNPLGVIRWNTHKRYLDDLAEHGVPTVPTVVLEAGAGTSLAALLAERGWTDVVIKAAVAQTGRYAMRVTPSRLAEGQAHLDRLLPHEDMLVQPWMPAVLQAGEVSLVYVDGEFTHAVRKRATGDSFLVHHDFGGSVRPTRPHATQLDIAARALAVAPEATRYARVDLVEEDAGRPVVMELELVEPELFFRYSEAAVERLVDAVEDALRA